MSGDGFATASFLNKQMKTRGLQKLRFYCQICQKQCRDENGYKSHSKSPSHLKKLSQMTHADIDKYTSQFQKEFLKLLRLSHGEKKVEANKFYNEYIQDKDHVHMNATKFTSLSRFIQHLSREGKIQIHGIEEVSDDTDPGRFQISYIDNSSESITRRKQLESIQENEKSEQDIKLRILERQISSARSSLHSDQEADFDPGLQGRCDGPIKLSVSKVQKKRPKKKLGNIFKK